MDVVCYSWLKTLHCFLKCKWLFFIHMDKLIVSYEESIWFFPQADGTLMLSFIAYHGFLLGLNPFSTLLFNTPFSLLHIPYVLVGITIATIWNKTNSGTIFWMFQLCSEVRFQRKQKTEAPDRWRRQNFLLTWITPVKESRRWSHRFPSQSKTVTKTKEKKIVWSLRCTCLVKRLNHLLTMPEEAVETI